MNITSGNILKSVDPLNGLPVNLRSGSAFNANISGASDGALIVNAFLRFLPNSGSTLLPVTGKTYSTTDNGTYPNEQIGVNAFLVTDNGATTDRVRSASKANLLAEAGVTSARGSISVTKRANWDIDNYPALNVAASAVKAAGGVGFIHVITGIYAYAVDSGVLTTIHKVDILNGAGNLFSIPMTSVNGSGKIELSDLSIPLTDNSSTTIQFAAAGGATVQQAVFMTGYTIL